LTTDGLTAAERTWTEETRHFWCHRAAYAKQQTTRPQTIGYSLVGTGRRLRGARPGRVELQQHIRVDLLKRAGHVR
jgi:hypothetical protein